MKLTGNIQQKHSLYSAIEKGIIALDSRPQGKAIRGKREMIIMEMALLKCDKPSFRKILTK